MRGPALNVGGSSPWTGSCTVWKEGSKLSTSIFSLHFLTDQVGTLGFNQAEFPHHDELYDHEQCNLFLSGVVCVGYCVAEMGQIANKKSAVILLKEKPRP